MENGGDVTSSILDELHAADIQGDQMEGENVVTRGVIDEVHFWDIQ